MSDLKKIDKISAAEVNQNGVVSLAVRPNRPSQYGEGNLSAKELQKRFDQLARLAIGKLNVIIELLEGTYSPSESGGDILGGEKESILEYILALKASENVPYDISLKELFNRILTEDGQLKVVDPASDNQDGYGNLNSVLSDLYNTVSASSAILEEINSILPRSMLVGTKGNNIHYFAFRDKDGNTIENSDMPIDLFSYHNNDTQAHGGLFAGVDEKIGDLSTALTEFKNNVNNILNSDDTDLDRIQEIVDYIKSNNSLIDAITISKVSVSDIVNDLETEANNKPLSASQGVILKDLIDAVADTCVKKVTDNKTRVAYVRESSGVETTKPIFHDYSDKEEQKENTGVAEPYGVYSIACRNKRGAITVANPKGKYDAVNLQTMNAALAALTPNIDLEELKTELDKRYAKLSDFEGVFDELHEYAQNIILFGEGN